ncbi:MAG: hypothetical protein JWN67_4612 [Actinomycetia bacterium]|nr:hypothetical protein [Actinomycetes bacterium]
MRKEQVTRIGLAYLALTELVPGVWGVLDPEGFFRNFPGFGRHWVAVEPPYNHHLVVDAASGFLAIGVALLLALVWRERRVRQLALVTYLAGTVPHAAYHLTHEADGLSTVDLVLSAGGLAVGCLVAVALLVRLRR